MTVEATGENKKLSGTAIRGQESSTLSLLQGGAQGKLQEAKDKGVPQTTFSGMTRQRTNTTLAMQSKKHG